MWAHKNTYTQNVIVQNNMQIQILHVFTQDFITYGFKCVLGFTYTNARTTQILFDKTIL